MIGLIATAAGGALARRATGRGCGSMHMTIAMSAGVAIMQVTMPTAVRAWVPNRIGFATAVYTNGLLVGEILPVALTLVLVLPLVGGSWEWGFVFWSVPVAAIAIVVMAMAPRQTAAAAAVRRKWWPDWRKMLIWRLGIMLGTINAIYFATNAFLPNYLNSIGQGEWISAALTALNVGPIAGLLHSSGSRRKAGTASLALRHLWCDRACSPPPALSSPVACGSWFSPEPSDLPPPPFSSLCWRCRRCSPRRMTFIASPPRCSRSATAAR